MTDGFSIDAMTTALRVRGPRIERIAAQTNFDNEESADRFQRDLARLGIDSELRRAGLPPATLVRIGSTRARMGGSTLGADVSDGCLDRPGSLGHLRRDVRPDPRRTSGHR